MPRRARSEPHQISLDDMLDDLRAERWDVYASSSAEPKRLEVMVGGHGFRVTVAGVEVYRGQNASDAVRAYNEALAG
jgi:hypothetical protein